MGRIIVFLMLVISINRLKEKNSNLIIKYEKMAEKEEWREVEGFEDYEVSNFGNVRSFITNSLLKPRNDNYGYGNVCLRKDNKSYEKKVHRLVALAFVENPDNKPFVDHKDRNPANNHHNNLRFCTQQENCFNTSMRKKNTSGVIGVTFDKSRNKWRAQIQINEKMYNLGRYDTLEEAKAVRLAKEKELFKEFAPN